MRKLFPFIILFLVGCGKSSENNMYFPVPPVTIPEAHPITETPPLAETTQKFTFANQDESSTRSNVTYQFNQALRLELPLKITTMNSTAGTFLVLNFKNFTCTFVKSGREYLNRDCTDVLQLDHSDYLYVDGMPFGMNLSFNVLFK